MKKRLMIYISSTLIIIFLIATMFFVYLSNYRYEENAKDQLLMNNKVIISMLKTNNVKDEEMLFKENLKKTEIRITYIDKQGNVLYDSFENDKKLNNHNDRKEVILARKNGEGYILRYSVTTDKTMIYCATTFNDGNIIRSAMPINIVNGFEMKYIKYYVLSIIFIGIMSIWISYKLSYIIVKPIRDLDFITARITKGEFHRRVTIISNDEIGQLGKNFNQMAEKLQVTLSDVLDKQNRLEAILKSMDSGIIAVDKNNRVIMINPYAQNIFGITKNIIGEKLLDSIRDFQLETIFKCKEGKYKEFKIVWPKERELRIKTADIINGEDHIGTVAVVQDITDIKRLENMRTQFVANVSHELKTPLTSIKGFAETLKYVDDIETRDKFLDIIDDEAERLTRLINDILILSDIEQQKELKKENVDINKLVKDVYTLIKNGADAKNIELSIIGEEVPNIIGDKDKLKQMLINLVDNAVKYADKDDKIWIGTKCSDNKCVIWVKDTGCGIPESKIPRLFERFYRVDKARSRDKGGTGLGLAIVKHIVLAHNGTIKVESKLGEGSNFIIEIPYT